MSQFPRRLIDELGEGDARQLLETACADEPPAGLVDGAILTASDGAAKPAPSSTGARSRGRHLALVTGALIVGTAAFLAGAHEQRSGTAPHDDTTTSAAPGEPPPASTHLVAPPATAAAAKGTSVADLPDAPAPRAAASPAPRPLARSEAATADLLREANQLRARGQWAEAAAKYQKVIDLGPDSAEAYPADVALGNLELQQNRPIAALARYEHALARHPNGGLTEEARWGKARALRAAGRSAEERDALEDFRTRHPDSPLAPVAKQRLAQIGDRR